MASFELMRELAVDNGTKIVLLLLDGLGGLPLQPGGRTELETARTPNMDILTRRAACGLSDPVAPGISPGSGPGHLGLFGYEPLKYQIGRGVLEALGIGFDLRPDDVAIRCNFCTVDEAGGITDRRAGRIPTEEGLKRVELLRQIETPGVEIFVDPVKEYRFTVVVRGEGLGADIDDTDPQRTGVPAYPLTAHDPASEKTVRFLQRWQARATDILAGHPPANSFTMRGFAKDPGLPSFLDVYNIKAAAIAVYPMYRGIARLLGMEVVEHQAQTPAEEFEIVRERWGLYDFFFVHIKATDSYGEDGNFEAKVKVIEAVDEALPILLELKPEVMVITGDHSTPALLRRHSWHPVPIMLVADKARRDSVTEFGETACLAGALGRMRHVDILPLALAHAMRLNKFGA